jgi:uncharacterized membrane protein
MKKQIPASLWVAIVALGIMALIHLGLAIKTSALVLLVSVVLEAILVAGLIYGQKWAYILVLVFSVLGVAASLSKGADQGLGVLLGNAIVVVPMVINTRFFFPKPQTPQGKRPEQYQA